MDLEHQDRVVILKRGRRIKKDDIQFIVNPLQTALDKIEASKSEAYSQALSLDVTNVFYDMLDYKINLSENISLEINGTTISGKTSVGCAIEMYVGKKRGTSFGVENIMQDQIDFLNHIKDVPTDKLMKTQWVVDETRSAIFQSGSVAQRMSLLDFNNICAVLELSVAWLNPQKFDTSHNSQYALLVWGRDVKYKLTKCLLYDISSQDLFQGTPLGFVIIDVSTFVGTDLEKEYLKIKMKRVDDQKSQAHTNIMETRWDVAERIAHMPEYDNCKNRRQRRIFVQSVVGDGLPNAVIEEIVELTQMLDYIPKPEKLKKEFKEN